jgi:hypothetical protein
MLFFVFEMDTPLRIVRCIPHQQLPIVKINNFIGRCVS